MEKDWFLTGMVWRDATATGHTPDSMQVQTQSVPISVMSGMCPPCSWVGMRWWINPCAWQSLNPTKCMPPVPSCLRLYAAGTAGNWLVLVECSGNSGLKLIRPDMLNLFLVILNWYWQHFFGSHKSSGILRSTLRQSICFTFVWRVSCLCLPGPHGEKQCDNTCSVYGWVIKMAALYYLTSYS